VASGRCLAVDLVQSAENSLGTETIHIDLTGERLRWSDGDWVVCRRRWSLLDGAAVSTSGSPIDC